MDSCFIFEQVQKMRPSSFSKKEQLRYTAEKMMLRQFMLMTQENQVPDYLSVRDMKTWLLKGRSFLKEFQEVIQRIDIKNQFKAELAWTTSRHLCIHQMEEELLDDLEKEKKLSQLFNRKVTLEGLQMYTSVALPRAEEDISNFLPTLHIKLLKIFGGIEITKDIAEDIKPPQLIELEESAALLVREVAKTTLKFYLEDQEQKCKMEAACAEITKLLTGSIAPCFSKFGSISMDLMLRLCTIAARCMVKYIFRRFDMVNKSFHLIHFDDSQFSARKGVISAIEDMGHKEIEIGLRIDGELEELDTVPTAASNWSEVQHDRHLEKVEASLVVSASEEQEEVHLKKEEALEGVSVDEEVANVSNMYTNIDQLEELDTVPTAADNSELLQDGHPEKSEASPGVSVLEEQGDGHLEKEEAFVGVSVDEEVATVSNMYTDTDQLEELYIVPTAADNSSELLQDQHLEKREASPVVSVLEEQDEAHLKKEEALEGVSVNEEVATVSNMYTNTDQLEELDTVPTAADNSSELLQDQHLEKSEASPVVSVLEEQDEAHLKKEEAFEGVSVDEEVSTVSNMYTNIDQLEELDTAPTAADNSSELLQDQHLEKREASPVVSVLEEQDEAHLKKRGALEGVSVDEEVATVSNMYTNIDQLEELDSVPTPADNSSEMLHDRHLEKREASPVVSVLEEQDEGHLKKREALEGVSAYEEVATVSNMYTNTDQLEELDSVPTAADNSSEMLHDRHPQKSEASTGVSVLEEQDEGHLEKEEAFVGVSVGEEVATVSNMYTNTDQLEELDTVPTAANNSSELLQDQHLEKREASPVVSVLEEQDEAHLKKEEAFVGVSVDEEMATVSNMYTNTDQLEELDTAPTAADNSSELLQDQHLEKREASPVVSALEEQDEGHLKKREALEGVSAYEEVATVSNMYTNTDQLEELDTVPTAADSSSEMLHDRHPQKSEDSTGVSVLEEQDEGHLEKEDVIVSMNNELEVLQEEEEEGAFKKTCLVLDSDVKNKKKKKGLKAFLCRCWRKMTCSASLSSVSSVTEVSPHYYC